MTERMLFFSELRTLLDKGAGWGHAKTAGVIDCIQERRNERGYGSYVSLANDDSTTTLRYGGQIGVAHRNPTDPLAPALGLAVAAARLAHQMRGRV